MSVARANVEFCKRVFYDRLGNPYVYGGNYDPFNKRIGTDCSGLVGDCLDAVNMGTAMPWKRSVSTESWGYDYRAGRPVPPGTRGPKGTIAVASLRDIPSDAAVIVNIHHGGGGADSHTQCIVDGIVMESNGSHGTCTRPGGAMDPNSSYWTDHWYLPGPIVDDGTPIAPVVLGVGSVGPEVVALQQRLNSEGAGLEVDGDYGPATANAVAAWDRRTPYARAVLAEGQRRAITPRGIQIAFSVVFVESGWKVYANARVPESLSIPHDAVGSDYDSVGLFQQRCPMWGPANVLMDPTKSAGLFYDRLAALDYNGTRPAGDYAADVQRPAAQYRGRYQERMGHAIALYNRITTTPTPGPQDELEEILMLAVPSMSIYANPGEPDVPIPVMIAAQDAHGPHEPYVENRARKGISDDVLRVARTAAGKGKAPYGTTPEAIAQASAVIAEIQATNPQFITAALNALAQKG